MPILRSKWRHKPEIIRCFTGKLGETCPCQPINGGGPELSWDRPIGNDDPARNIKGKEKEIQSPGPRSNVPILRSPPRTVSFHKRRTDGIIHKNTIRSGTPLSTQRGIFSEIGHGSGGERKEEENGRTKKGLMSGAGEPSSDPAPPHHTRVFNSKNSNNNTISSEPPESKPGNGSRQAGTMSSTTRSFPGRCPAVRSTCRSTTRSRSASASRFRSCRRPGSPDHRRSER